MERSYETKEDALKRNKEQKQTKAKNHIGNIENYRYDKEKLKQEVDLVIELCGIFNWSKLARTCSLIDQNGKEPKNAGQVMKTLVENLGIGDLEKYSNKRKSCGTDIVSRRKKLKGMGGEIAVPCERTEDRVKETVKEDIETGKIKIGNLINPKEITKIVLKDNKVLRENFIVHGRKIPLAEIRKDLVDKQFKYMRFKSSSYYSNLDINSCT